MAEKAVKFTLQVTLADEGGQMFSSTNEWANLPYSVAVQIEGKLIAILADLNELGKTANPQADVVA